MKKTLKKILIITAIVLATLVVLGLVTFGIFWYQNIHWYDKYQKGISKNPYTKERESVIIEV